MVGHARYDPFADDYINERIVTHRAGDPLPYTILAKPRMVHYAERPVI